MNLKELPRNLLVEVSLLLLEDEDFDFIDPYDEFDDNESSVEEASKWTSADV